MGLPISSGPSAVNTAIPLVIPGRKGYAVLIIQLSVSYAGGAVTGRATIADSTKPAVNAEDWDITTTGPTILFSNSDGMEFGDNADATITLAAGGAGITGKINCVYRLKKL